MTRGYGGAAAVDKLARSMARWPWGRRSALAGVMFLYYYSTSVGLLWIKPQPGAPGRWWLGIDNAGLESYHSHSRSPATPTSTLPDHASGIRD
jgi:hypothetical protein